MILLDLKREIERRGSASLADLSRHFGSDPATLRPMVEHWLRRGKVRRVDLGCDSCKCPNCGHMTDADREIYATARQRAAPLCGGSGMR